MPADNTRLLGVNAANIPNELKAIDRWVNWRNESRDGKFTKVPYDARTGRRASSTDPANWSTFGDAHSAYEKSDEILGLGFVLTGDGIAGVDLDNCIDPLTREISPAAMRVIELLDSYTELSPSGQGIRIFVMGGLPPSGRKRGNIEAYDSGRYLTVTGAHLEGTPLKVESRDAELKAFHTSVFGASTGNGQESSAIGRATADNAHIGRASPAATLRDEELIERAISAKNSEKFEGLWGGEWQSAGYPSQSEADLALCCQLAFWSGRNAATMDRLFRKTGLMRAKWDQPHSGDGRTYGQVTIDNANAFTPTVYDPNHISRQTANGEFGYSDPNPNKSLETNGHTSEHCDQIVAGERSKGRFADAAQLPKILVSNRPLREISADALSVLEDANNPQTLFVRGGALARVRRDEKGRPVIETLGEAHLRGRLTRAANFVKKVEKGEKHVTPPLDVVRDVLAKGEWPASIPPLAAIVDAPVLRPDGSILSEAGYDPATRLWYSPASELELPVIPSQPSAEELQAAVALIREAVEDFPFVDEPSRANALALTITPFVRHLIGGSVPMALVNKPKSGTGASLLTEAIAVIATGRPAAMMGAPETDDE